jgi:hypothetical protein
MIKYIAPVTMSLLFLGCSFQPDPNLWQKRSTTAFNNYQKDFLENNMLLAKSDLNRAVDNAKMSANLTQLAKIYLGECALNISVGESNECKKYQNVESLVNRKELNAYYHLLRGSLGVDDIENLPKSYQRFATALLEKNYVKANREVFVFKRATSSLLSAQLLGDKLESKSRVKVLELASYYGYKKSVLFWLKESKKYVKSENELENICKKISILTQ